MVHFAARREDLALEPAEAVKPLYLQYAKLEEDFGLAKRAMRVYDQATKAVLANEIMGMYEIYIARAAEIFGVPKKREIYEKEIESGLPDKDIKRSCVCSMRSLREASEKLTAVVHYINTLNSLPTLDLTLTSGLSGMSLKCSMEMKIHSVRCSELKEVFLQAIARHTLSFRTI